MPCACAVPRRERRGVLQGGLVGKGSAFAVSVLLSLLAPATRLAAQGGGGGGGGTIRGHVADSAGTALARVAVSVDAIGARTTTDVQGNYEIRGVPAGTYTVRVRLLGYVPQSVQVTVGDVQPTRHDFSMRVQPISLAPVDVVVGSRARHTAAQVLAVPVGVFNADHIQRLGTTG